MKIHENQIYFAFKLSLPQLPTCILITFLGIIGITTYHNFT